MMHYKKHSQAGFTAVELLVTLFVAAAFLVSGYQLFNVVLLSSSDTRGASRADNTAYTYLRQHAEAAQNPCVASTPLGTTSIAIEGLANPTVTVVISCPVASAPSMSKVESTVIYGPSSDRTTVKRSVYVKQ